MNKGLTFSVKPFKGTDLLHQGLYFGFIFKMKIVTGEIEPIAIGLVLGGQSPDIIFFLQQYKVLFQVPGTWCPGLLGYDVGRAGALLALLDVEGDCLSLGQRFEAAALDGAVVDEDVLRAVGRGDEAEAFFVAEPLDCACSH